MMMAKTINDGGTYYASDYQALVNRGQALNSSAIGLDVVGGVAMAAGTVWMIVYRLRHHIELPQLRPSGAGLAFHW